MYGIIYKLINKTIVSRKLKKKIKYLNYLNWRGFYVFHNFHTQFRKSWNVTRVYLLNNKLWYFQKKNFLTLPINFHKMEIKVLSQNNNYKKLVSKIKWFY